MAYPTFEQYNNALQAHQKLLTDPELQSGLVAKTGLGIPLAISGGFALTYTIKTGSKKYAVRCFHRESKALERRYQAIAKKLAQLRSPYFLDFQFQPDGIHINGGAYPIVKMAWAQGETLGEFLEDNRSQKGALANLPGSIQALAAFLEKERIAHGDMSTGNIMVSAKGGTLQLIDYDGMFVEDIKTLGSSELGNINFQHPGRSAQNPFSPTMDRFSLISLFLALKALHEDSALWDKTNSDMDAIVFRANDYVDPSSSQVFSALMGKPSLAPLVQRFAAICKAPLDQTPSLDDFLAGKNIPASVFQISTKTQEGSPKLGYMGVYDVLDATGYEACLRRVGDKVEVIGRIVEVKWNKARNGKPYIFINFGPWQGKIFKVSIWSEGLAVISNQPDSSWVGKWVSVIGLLEPPYVNQQYRYSHISINVMTNNQMTIISDSEAKWRLTPTTKRPASPSVKSNKEMLDKLKGKTAVSASQGPATSSPSNQSILTAIRNSQGGTQSKPTQVPPPQKSQPQQPRPTYQQPHPSYHQQRPPEKGLVEKLFDWIFK